MSEVVCVCAKVVTVLSEPGTRWFDRLCLIYLPGIGVNSRRDCGLSDDKDGDRVAATAHRQSS